MIIFRSFSKSRFDISNLLSTTIRRIIQNLQGFAPISFTTYETNLHFTPTDFYKLIRGPSVASFLSYTLILSVLKSLRYGLYMKSFSELSPGGLTIPKYLDFGICICQKFLLLLIKVNCIIKMIPCVYE